ncbi:MAG: hypothetical protein ACREJB_01290 [Planctomycetaceae bacterium]
MHELTAMHHHSIQSESAGEIEPQSPGVPERQIVPAECGGKWIVWDDGGRIVGVGDSLNEAEEQAVRAGVAQGAFEWVPPAEEWDTPGDA